MTFDRDHGRTLLVFTASLAGEAIDENTVEKILDGYEREVLEVSREEPEPCARLMIGCRDDTYDPVCTLTEGHDGPCRSTGALSPGDQPSSLSHRWGPPDDGLVYCERCGIYRGALHGPYASGACSGIRGVPPGQPKARSTDPATAKAAAQREGARRLSQPRRLLLKLNEAWWAPRIAEQLADATGMPLSSASTRMSELVKAGLVVERGTRRTRNGAPATAYAITPEGQAAATSLDPVPLG